jgi:large subunit ribosomal protein L7Ae
MKRQINTKIKSFLDRQQNSTEPIKTNFQTDPKIFGIHRKGYQNRKLSRFIKWPKYIRIQKQRCILSKKLKIPTMISQFTKILNFNLTRKVFEILSKYKTKDKNHNETEKNIEQIEKNRRENNNKKVFFLKHGINTVTNLVRKKKALFVLIANDVSPVEMVIWLPSLCKKLNIPFCIIKNKTRLGNLVKKKKTSCLAIESFLNKDKSDIIKIMDCFRSTFDQKFENNKK